MDREEREEFKTERRNYVIGLVSAVVLTAIPFALVAGHALSRPQVLVIVACLALVQIVVHFRFFLHIDLSKSKRDDLQLILFSTLIVVLMVGGTIWIISNQHARMM